MWHHHATPSIQRANIILFNGFPVLLYIILEYMRAYNLTKPLFASFLKEGIIIFTTFARNCQI